MRDFIHSDIFFFITSIAIIVITVLLSIILFCFIRIIHNIEKISEVIRDEVARIKKDVSRVHKTLGAIIEGVYKFGSRALSSNNPKKYEEKK